jgi:hypothetical protein
MSATKPTNGNKGGKGVDVPFFDVSFFEDPSVVPVT